MKTGGSLLLVRNPLRQPHERCFYVDFFFHHRLQLEPGGEQDFGDEAAVGNAFAQGDSDLDGINAVFGNDQLAFFQLADAAVAFEPLHRFTGPF